MPLLNETDIAIDLDGDLYINEQKMHVATGIDLVIQDLLDVLYDMPFIDIIGYKDIDHIERYIRMYLKQEVIERDIINPDAIEVSAELIVEDINFKKAKITVSLQAENGKYEQILPSLIYSLRDGHFISIIPREYDTILRNHLPFQIFREYFKVTGRTSFIEVQYEPTSPYNVRIIPMEDYSSDLDDNVIDFIINVDSPGLYKLIDYAGDIGDSAQLVNPIINVSGDYPIYLSNDETGFYVPANSMILLSGVVFDGFDYDSYINNPPSYESFNVEVSATVVHSIANGINITTKTLPRGDIFPHKYGYYKYYIETDSTLEPGEYIIEYGRNRFTDTSNLSTNEEVEYSYANIES